MLYDLHTVGLSAVGFRFNGYNSDSTAKKSRLKQSGIQYISNLLKFDSERRRM